MVSDLVPSPLNHIRSYCCDGCSDPILKVLDIPNLFTILNVLDVSPQKKNLGGQKIGLPLPIQALGNFSFRALCVDWQK